MIDAKMGKKAYRTYHAIVCCSNIMDTLLGDFFVEIEMPEKPKEGFFTGLFGGGSKPFDREELCT